MGDSGSTDYGTTLDLPDDNTVLASDPDGGHFTWWDVLRRLVGFRNDYNTNHRPNANAHHNRLHALDGASDHSVPTGPVSFGGQKIASLADGTATTDAATWGQVQAFLNGLDWGHPSARAATAAALPAYTRTANVITANANGALAAVDTVTLVANDRLLLKDGAAGADNGIYVVTTVGDGSTPFVLTRATDADTSAEVNPGLMVIVEEGTTNDNTVWILATNGPITLNSTALSFQEMPTALALLAGAGMTRTGNTMNVVAADGSIIVNADSIQAADGGVIAAKLAKALYDANTIVKADTDDTPVALTMGASTMLARLAAGGIVAATPAEIKTLLALAESDVANLTTDLAAKVPNSLYDANTVLAANADDTPAALTMGASTILARLAAGNIKAATPAEIKTLLGAGAASGLATLDSGSRLAQLPERHGLPSHATADPDNWVSSNLPRNTAHSAQTLLTSGRLGMVLCPVEAGQVVTNISFFSYTQAAVSPTHWWFCLYTQARGLIGTTADQLTAAWAATTLKTLALTSPYTVPATAKVYVGIVVVAGTVPNLAGVTCSQAFVDLVPVSAGSADTGLNVPADAPATATTIGTGTQVPIVFLT